MSRLTALRPVLYLSRQYQVGEALPVSDPAMVKAWLTAESAKWEDETTGAEPEKPRTKAKAAAAAPGAEGQAYGGTILQGKVSKTPGRAKK